MDTINIYEWFFSLTKLIDQVPFFVLFIIINPDEIHYISQLNN